MKPTLVFLAILFSIAFGQTFIPATDPNIYYNGRVQENSDKSVSFDWSGIEIRCVFDGTSISAAFSGSPNDYNAFVDGNLVTVINVTTGETYPIAKDLASGSHSLLITKRTEAFFGVQHLTGIVVDSGKGLHPPPKPPTRRIEIIGDSITCGYGDEGKFPCSFSAGTENNYEAYGPQIAAHFNAEYYLECWSGKGIVRNYGYPNITSPDAFPVYYNRTFASQDNSPIWNFKWRPDVVIINLGTNDCSTDPIPPPPVFEGGYKDFIDTIRKYYGNDVQFFLACGPMLGASSPCCGYVQNVVAQNQPNMHYIDLVGILEYPNDYGCDYHPSVSGHAKMAQKSIPVIAEAMGW